MLVRFFFFQAEDGIRDLVRSRGLGDVYKRQAGCLARHAAKDRLMNQRFIPAVYYRGGSSKGVFLSLIHI